MRVIFAGGGTAGHINPAIALAKHLKKKRPACEILFVGTERGMETELVPKAGFAITYMDVLGFRRSFSRQNICAALKALAAYRKGRALIRSFRPDLVVGTGGYVSGPVLAAAAHMRIPTLIHEQNVSPGLTSRMLSGLVDAVCISFEQSRKAFPKAKKIICTGNPLREELFTVGRTRARSELGLDQRPFVAAFGGSLGAQRLNDALLGLIRAAGSRPELQLLMATGAGQYEAVLKAVEEENLLSGGASHIKIVPYIHNMPHVLAAADLVIARAGAITVSELTALGKASILVPSPNVTDNHQAYNARALEEAGAALVYLEEELSEGTLPRAVFELCGDLECRMKMEKNAAALGIRDGVEQIYAVMEGLLEKHA